MGKYKWEKEPESKEEAMRLLEEFFQGFDTMQYTFTQGEYFLTLNGLLRNAYSRKYLEVDDDFIAVKGREGDPSHHDLTVLIERVRRANKDTGMPLISHEMSKIIGYLTRLRDILYPVNGARYYDRAVELFTALEKDNHRYQGSRPCSTCSDISELIGAPFGCKKKAVEEERRRNNTGE